MHKEWKRCKTEKNEGTRKKKIKQEIKVVMVRAVEEVIAERRKRARTRKIHKNQEKENKRK